MKTSLIARWLALLALSVIALSRCAAAEAAVLRVMLLGDKAGHRPSDFNKAIQPALRQKNIELVYTEELADLNSSKLAGFDCLMIFANWTRIQPEQESALLQFVERGGGFVPVHCASYCFL